MRIVHRDGWGRFARIWSDTSDAAVEHSCHIHPLGSSEYVRYWCGHTCVEPVCLRFRIVWMVTHPASVWSKYMMKGNR